MRHRGLATALVVLALAGCTPSDPDPTATTSPVATESPAAPLEPAPTFTEAEVNSARYNCLEDVPALEYYVAEVGGREVGAAAIGDGEVGVVLAHQANGNLCQWWSYATTLQERGYRVIVPSVEGDAALNVRGAVQTLMADGVTDVVLIGASRGGTAVLVVATQLETAPAAVVALSAPTSHDGMDALAAVGSVSSPLLIAAATDEYTFAQAAEQLAAAATAEPTELVLVEDSTRHGVALLGGGAGIDDELDAFLAEHAPPG